jgi:uncharacterized protein YkwD
MRPVTGHTHRLCVALATAAISLALVPAAHACQNADAVPSEASEGRLVRSTLCLVNGERGKRRMRKLRLNNRLSQAARRHAGDMVRRDYFSHDSANGLSFVDRIKRTGYLESAQSWAVGENLAWGAGERSTPRSRVRAWMASPGHRANILNRRFREVGIGIVFGAPSGSWDDSATYATEFGIRG